MESFCHAADFIKMISTKEALLCKKFRADFLPQMYSLPKIFLPQMLGFQVSPPPRGLVA